MLSQFPSMPVPLYETLDGEIRVKDTDVTLAEVINQFNEGYTAEEVSQKMPDLRLSDIYLIFAFNLSHRIEVESYLRRHRNFTPPPDIAPVSATRYSRVSVRQ